MKKLIIAFTMICFACGDDGVDVLSSDGNKDMGYCGAEAWVSCLHEKCPNGYDIIKKGNYNTYALIKCRP